MKQVIQGFAAALLLAGACMLVLYFASDDGTAKTTSAAPIKKEELDTEEMKTRLEKDDYYILSSKDYEELQKKTETKDKAKTASEQTKKFQLKLESGMTSDEVAQLLEKKSILEDGDAFLTYLNVTNASKSLQVGTYDVNSDMSYDEITDLLTK
ncbi:endolytic transglycosylase MltG [Terribacillus sp. DMT04]|uniref:endolytic transglycosylase MltG n=1 Tax=Terribacillus sp. DMT04 TaxID=2850441 RepID=UPI001C2B8C49|nr:endolytic transglycosylase MltG [Terribacillus sp. DMT04]QXE00430.1 endolytic transglycosylase MltG [Terribacillus sp. DMT04]